MCLLTARSVMTRVSRTRSSAAPSPIRRTGIPVDAHGTARTNENGRFGKLARRLGAGTARILSATVSRTAGRWLVSFTVEVERAIPGRHARAGSAIGVDLGVRTQLTGVDDQGNVVTVPGPKALRSSLRRLRRASRAHCRKAVGSANHRKSAARLARIPRRDGKTRPGRARPGETGTRRCPCRSDRDSQRATAGCGIAADGGQPVTRVLDHADYQAALRAKLLQARAGRAAGSAGG
jgi:hypothetical protein